MMNLLPPKEKEQLFWQKRQKLAIVWGSIILISLVVLLLVLLSLRIRILVETEKIQAELTGLEQEYRKSDLLKFEEIIKKHNSHLIESQSFYNRQVYFYKTIMYLLEIDKPNGLRLTSLELEKTKENQMENLIRVSLTGTSNNRENLAAFKSNIESSDKIINLKFPPENWIKSENIDFNLSFDIK